MADSIFSHMENDETLEKISEMYNPRDISLDDENEMFKLLVEQERKLEGETKKSLEENVKYYDHLESRVLILERQMSRLLIHFNLDDKSEILITDKLPEE